MNAQRKQAAISALCPAVAMTAILGFTIGTMTDDLRGFLFMLPMAAIGMWISFYGIARALDTMFDAEEKRRP